MQTLKRITATHVLLSIIAVFSALNYVRTNQRIHELDQDVDNIVDFTQITSDTLQAMQASSKVPTVTEIGDEWKMSIAVPHCASVQNVQVIWPAVNGNPIEVRCDNLK